MHFPWSVTYSSLVKILPQGECLDPPIGLHSCLEDTVINSFLVPRPQKGGKPGGPHSLAILRKERGRKLPAWAQAPPSGPIPSFQVMNAEVY